jgi:lipopolysaccharide/colanic/teichoic acid biosynthesis glycosyltransferase
VSKLTERLRSASGRLTDLLTDTGARVLWVLVFLILLAVVAAANPAKLLVFAWLAAKIIGAALIGVALFRTWDVKPETVEGIEHAMAHTRRVTLMAAAIVAAAFAP